MGAPHPHVSVNPLKGGGANWETHKRRVKPAILPKITEANRDGTMRSLIDAITTASER